MLFVVPGGIRVLECFPFVRKTRSSSKKSNGPSHWSGRRWDKEDPVEPFQGSVRIGFGFAVTATDSFQVDVLCIMYFKS